MEGIAPVLAVKVAVVAFARRLMVAGTVRTLAAPERATEAPPAAAALFNVTVQLVLLLEVKVAAVHCSDETSTGFAKEMVEVLEEPLREAVTVAVWLVLNWLAVTVNVPLPDPAAMASEFVAVLIMPVVASVTFAPPDPAGPLRFTVQVAAAPEPKDAGLHVRELIVGGEESTVTVPPVALTETELPPGDAAIAPLTPILIAAQPDTVAETVATTPFALAMAFMPLARQVYPTDVVAHVRVLSAAVNDGPAATERLDTVPGKVRVHSRPATDVPLGEESERFNETVAPAAAVFDESARDVDWASAVHGESSSATGATILSRARFRIKGLRKTQIPVLLANVASFSKLLRNIA